MIYSPLRAIDISRSLRGGKIQLRVICDESTVAVSMSCAEAALIASALNDWAEAV
jgi:hypothetical protein